MGVLNEKRCKTARFKSLKARFPKGSNDLKQSTPAVCGFKSSPV